MGEGREAGGKLERGQGSDQLNKQCIKTNAFPQQHLVTLCKHYVFKVDAGNGVCFHQISIIIQQSNLDISAGLHTEPVDYFEKAI